MKAFLLRILGVPWSCGNPHAQIAPQHYRSTPYDRTVSERFAIEIADPYFGRLLAQCWIRFEGFFRDRRVTEFGVLGTHVYYWHEFVPLFRTTMLAAR